MKTDPTRGTAVNYRVFFMKSQNRNPAAATMMTMTTAAVSACCPYRAYPYRLTYLYRGDWKR